MLTGFLDCPDACLRADPDTWSTRQLTTKVSSTQLSPDVPACLASSCSISIAVDLAVIHVSISTLGLPRPDDEHDAAGKSHGRILPLTVMPRQASHIIFESTGPFSQTACNTRFDRQDSVVQSPPPSAMVGCIRECGLFPSFRTHDVRGSLCQVKGSGRNSPGPPCAVFCLRPRTRSRSAMRITEFGTLVARCNCNCNCNC